MYVAIFILVMLGAILLHEAGHFSTAKMFGMKVTQFFAGFGPTIWSFQRGETEYGFKWIPAGGFVRIIGMNPWEETDPEDDGRLFYQQAPWKRFIVLVAGSFTHFVLALLFLWGALSFVGLYEVTNEIASVVDDSPAALAGLTAGDVVVSIDDVPVDDFEALVAAVEPRYGETITVAIERDGTASMFDVTLDQVNPSLPEGAAPKGFLGVAPAATSEPNPLGPIEGARQTLSGPLSLPTMATQTMSGLAQVFAPKALVEFFTGAATGEERGANSVTSLVGAGQIVNEFGQRGDVFAVLAILAQLNLVIGILNLLPLPPFDGGHVAIMFIEEVVNLFRRGDEKFHLDPKHVTPVALAVMGFFIALTLVAFYLDVTQPASQLID